MEEAVGKKGIKQMSLILNEHDFDRIIDVPPDGIRLIGDLETPQAEEALKNDKRIDKIIIPESCLLRRVNKLASEILRDYKNADSIDMVVVLTGAIIFASDLSRFLYSVGRINTDFHFVKTSVYEGEIKKDNEEHREVRILLPTGDIAKKNVLIVEDIVDQGFTLSWLIKYLKDEKDVNSVKVCVLLDKKLDNPTPDVKQTRDNLRVDYVGFSIPDRWVVGYGCNTTDGFRNMPFIATVNEEYYK